MRSDPGKPILKGVSRSFYLTLRLLPAPMREAASLGYLLARTSDTLADSAALSTAVRLSSLEEFGQALAGDAPAPRWPGSLLSDIANPKERLLLENSSALFAWLDDLPEAEARLVREVVEIIISGQTLDLQRFMGAGDGMKISLGSDAVLEDYTWRVAGCVGAFWTKLGFLTLGQNFSSAPEAELLEMGITYGKGLQLVNILRDVAEDLAVGRCYLPVENPDDAEELKASHAQWRQRALERVGEGERYAATLTSRRLRAATVLPALIARKTLNLMQGKSWEMLGKRVKIPRSEVYRSLIRALAH